MRFWKHLLCAGFGVAGASIAHADPLATPAMSTTLSSNASPTSVEFSPLGKIYIGGAASVMAFGQSNTVPGDHSGTADISNAQLFIQKTDGPLQFYVQIGGYSLPSLGSAYSRFWDATKNSYGVVPVAYLKFAPNANFNIIAGKLPTLVGAEYTFTFQNNNIERGLLWNQEPAVSEGVQANYTKGPLAISASWRSEERRVGKEC